jgi:hypothetical protein
VVLVEYALVAVVIVLRHNLIGYVYTLGNQFFSAARQWDPTLLLFPYYMIPPGLATLFGLQALNADIPNPMGSVLIGAGIVLLAVALVTAAREARRPAPFACLLLVQAALGFMLFRTGSDFGLYKLAMFIQPALAASLACALVRFGPPRGARRSWRPVSLAAAAVLFAITAPTALKYTRASLGARSGGLVELQEASRGLADVPPRPPAGTRWASGVENIAAVKVAANLYRGTDIKFLARDFFQTIKFLIDYDWPLMSWYPHRENFHIADALVKARSSDFFVEHTLFGTRFTVVRQPDPPSAFLNLPSRLSLFNKLHPGEGPGRGLFSLVPAGDVRNLLVFVHSSLGNHYYLADDRRKISFYQQEADFFDPRGDFNAIGRFLLFRVENPTSSVYLRLSFSKTLMGPGRTALSRDAVILGKGEVPLGLRGDGAANIIVGPIVPVQLDGGSYIALDFRQAPTLFPFHRTGLKGLYNTNIPLDYRELIGFARDISALSPEEVAALPRPRRVADFPLDLVRAAGLEYAGIYEDGRLSPDTSFVLGEARAGDELHIKGCVEQLPGGYQGGDALVSIDGGPSVRLPVPAGRYFDWRLPIAHPGRTTRVTLHFTVPGVLPGGDGRPVGGKLDLLEVGPP